MKYELCTFGSDGFLYCILENLYEAENVLDGYYNMHIQIIYLDA